MGLTSSNTTTNKTFFSIIGGKFKQPSTEGTPGAEKREWETKDGKSGVKWEITHDNLEGKIVGLRYKDGDYGTSLVVTIQNGNDMGELQISTKSRYYDDIAKKLKSIDLEKTVTLSPYDFEGQNKKGEDKKFTGITVIQGNEKVTSYYYDGKKNINKMPAVDKKEKEELGDAYWTVYFAKVGAFLKKEVEGIKVPEPTPIDPIDAAVPEEPKMPDTEEVDDLPF
jgi:hypothetical protein